MAPVHVTGQVLGVVLVMTTEGRLNALVCLSVLKDSFFVAINSLQPATVDFFFLNASAEYTLWHFSSDTSVVFYNVGRPWLTGLFFHLCSSPSTWFVVEICLPALLYLGFKVPMSIC